MRRLACLLAVLTVFGVGGARAHDIVVWAEVADGSLIVETYFTDGRAPQAATVMVQDVDGEVLVEGPTDAAGRFTVPVPGDLPLVIRVDAGHGHGGSAVLTEHGLGSATGSQ